MGQVLVPPIDNFRTQKNPISNETLPIELSTLIQAYEAVRQGRITDAKTIRTIARQFEAIADNPQASGSFPYDAGRIAAALYNWALDNSMRAKDPSGDRTSHTVNKVDSVDAFSETSQTTTETSPKTFEVSKVTETTTEKIQSLDKPPPFTDNTRDLAQSVIMERDAQKRIGITRDTIIPEHSSEIKSEVGGTVEANIKVTSGIQPNLTDPIVTLRALLELSKLAEEEFVEEGHTTEEGLEGSINHNAMWDDWEG